MTTLNLLGKACPIPVLETRKALAQMNAGDICETLVDNETAVQNLSKMATQKNLTFTSEQLEEHRFSVRIVADGVAFHSTEEEETPDVCIPCTPQGKTVVVLSSETMGEGDPVLGQKLMQGFVYALTEQDRLPDTILLYNGGAKLSVEGAATLSDLKLMEEEGVEILTCGTCLNHYGLTEKLGVGSITNMYVICQKMSEASFIIKP